MNYSPLLPEVRENPYPYYAYLREHAPVYWVESLQSWAVSRYADVDYILRNPQIFSSRDFIANFMGDLNPVPEVPWMIDLDPPVHTKIRKLVNKAFAPRLIIALESRIREICSELLNDLRSRSEFDLVRDFSAPLPVIVIAELLGVDARDRADFKRWSDAFMRATARPTDEAERAEIRRETLAMRAYLEDVIAQRRKEPREDLITRLVQAEEDQQTLTALEVLALSLLVLVAGNETTTNLIGNTVLTLLDHPAELAKVKANRAFVPQMIEEVLRYDCPVQGVARVAVRDVELAGTTISAGANVMYLNASANRDERRYEEPDRFDVLRNPRDHLAFGYGIHYCLGAQLARLEAKVAMEGLLFEQPPFVRTGELTRVEGIAVRGPKTLPMRFETARSASAAA
jgi:cytochrome P450